MLKQRQQRPALDACVQLPPLVIQRGHPRRLQYGLLQSQHPVVLWVVHLEQSVQGDQFRMDRL